MRTTLLMLVMLALVMCLGIRMCGVAKPGTSAFAKLDAVYVPAPKKPSFDTDVKPILQSRCQPCHFPGGKVYAHMPFDKPETITRLGEKMFTRIKDKEEQRVIREFLAQP